MHIWDSRFFPQSSYTMFFHDTKSFCINNVFDENNVEKIDIWNRLIPYYMQGDIDEILNMRSLDRITEFLMSQFPYHLDIGVNMKVDSVAPSVATDNIKRANAYFKRICSCIEADYFLFEWDYDEDKIAVYFQAKFDFFTAKMLA